MHRMIYLLLFMISIGMRIEGHEGHSKIPQVRIDSNELISDPHYPDYAFRVAIKQIGNLHFIFIHFPIALIVMTVAAELLFWWTGVPLYASSARFMINAAAVMAIPAVLFGLALGFGSNYEGDPRELYEWHRFFGILTGLLALLCAGLKEINLRQGGGRGIYSFCLGLAFISLSITGFLGGNLTFGIPGF